MNIEQELLIALLRNPTESKINALLSKKIDWLFFVNTAKNHRVIPLLFQNLRTAKNIELPPEVSVDLSNRAKKAALGNLGFFAELKSLAKIFEENGIEFLNYKGITLSQLAYRAPSLRRFGDIDIFIRKSDFAKANKVIIENGGRAVWDLSESQERAVRNYYYEYPYFFGRRPILVEVHWAFMESFFGFDYEKADVFERSQMVSVHGRDFRSLSNEDLLIILCAHGSKHYWTRLSWICDVAKLVESQTIDWLLVAKLAKQYGASRMVAIGMKLAEEMFHADISDELRKQLKINDTVCSIANMFKEQLFEYGVPDESIRIKLHLKMRERWRDKLTYSRRLFRTKVVDSIFMPMGRPT